MKNLLRVDFKRVLKDKLFMVICIIALSCAVVMPMLYVSLFFLLGGGDISETRELMSLLGVTLDAKYLFFDSLSIGNNLGLILPIFVGIIMFKDLSKGTIRNKIIGGYKRTSIFASNFIVSFTVMFGVIFAQAIVTLLVSLIFFPFQSTPFVIGDLWTLLLSLLFDTLIYLLVSALVTFLCATKKSAGIVIVLYIAIALSFSILGSILQIAQLLVEVEGSSKFAVGFLEFIQNINVFTYGTTIGGITKYTWSQALYFGLAPIIFTIGLLLLGVYKFNKRDLK